MLHLVTRSVTSSPTRENSKYPLWIGIGRDLEYKLGAKV